MDYTSLFVCSKLSYDIENVHVLAMLTHADYHKQT